VLAKETILCYNKEKEKGQKNNMILISTMFSLFIVLTILDDVISVWKV
jgi:hypothetical protein